MGRFKTNIYKHLSLRIKSVIRYAEISTTVPSALTECQHTPAALVPQGRHGNKLPHIPIRIWVEIVRLVPGLVDQVLKVGHALVLKFKLSAFEEYCFTFRNTKRMLGKQSIVTHGGQLAFQDVFIVLFVDFLETQNCRVKILELSR